LIAEPENAEAIRNTIHGAARKAAAPKAPKAPKATKAPKVVAPKKAATKTAAPKKVAAKKSVAEIKAANLAKLKAVGAKFKADRPMTDADILRDEPKATTFSLDGDWDSIDGLDLSKLI
jgi:hypothetical protein